jgi:foldase protein PrsA
MKLAALFLIIAAGCGPSHEKPVVAPFEGDKPVKTAPGTTPGSTPGKVTSGDPSADILSREPVTNIAQVKHVLIGWAALASAYHGDMDPRAGKRNQTDAQKLAREVLARLQKGEKIEPIMLEISEDPGSAQTGDGYEVTPEARLVPEFIQLGLRLNVGEAGIVQTVYGYHVIQRVE